jgi:hypothetical protein
MINIEVNKNMEEIVTVGGKQFKLTTDRPLTVLERQQTIEQIQRQTGCSSCGPRTMSSGFGDIQSLSACATASKKEGDVVTLQAHPLGGVGPYNVRFWKKHSAIGYAEVGSPITNITEGSYVTASFTIFDTDYVLAIGDASAMIPSSSTTGLISETGGASILATGSIRVATTTFDSCPTTPSTCTEWCDISLTCVAPTCNFVVS